MITIKEALTKTELLDYVKFPFKLYKNHPYWVPPLINDELETFDKSKNPAFQTADAHFLLAYKNNKIVGRIAAIINWTEVNDQKKSKMRFGWWDVIDDIEVTKALLQKVAEIGKTHNLEHMEGPMGFSNLDKVGAITEGYNELGSMITWYNYPYYIDHLRQLGFVEEKQYLENKFSFNNIQPEYFRKANDLVKKRYELTCLNFTSSKQLLPYVDEMFDLFNDSYANLESFVPINNVQKTYFKNKYISFINPDYIKFVIDKNGKMVAFSIVMPSFSEALKKANGKLFPFGFYHMLKAKKHSKDILFYLIGVAPDYQNKGVTAMIFNDNYEVFKDKNIDNCIRTPELANNIAIHNIWKHFNPITFRKRSTFIKNI